MVRVQNVADAKKEKQEDRNSNGKIDSPHSSHIDPDGGQKERVTEGDSSDQGWHALFLPVPKISSNDIQCTIKCYEIGGRFKQ